MSTILGSTPITAVLGAAPPADAETARLKSFAKAATGAGLALLLIAPNSKLPVDMRSPVQRRKEDAAAQDAAKEAGRTDYLKARSLAGAHLATTDPAVICRYIDKYRKTYGEDTPVNFALEVGRSKLVVVDADTAEQVSAFLADAQVDPPIPPTVLTPGQVGLDGEMAHKDGGHFYFTVDETQTPGLGETGTGSYTAPGGYVALWRDRYVLIPPSVRPEGAYQLAGREYPLPGWIANTITERTARRNKHAASVPGETGELNEAVDAWASTVSWADILSPLGWVITARPDRCGCDIWTAPGAHASPKSATTHDTGCELGRYTAENAPMHIWTDNPGPEFEEWIAAHGGSKTLSKLQAVAIASYKGDVGTACAELGFIPGKDEHMAGLAFDGSAAEHEAGVDASTVGETITLPNPEDIDPAAAHPQLNEHQKTCPHSAVSPINRCYSCGLDVSSLQETARVPEDAAEPVPEASDGTPPVTPPEEETPFPDVDGEPDGSAVLISDDSQVPDIAPFDYWRDLPAPEYAIEGIIEHQALSCLIGPPGVGKSTVAIDMACSLVTGQRWQGRRTIRQRVLYLPGEGLSGAVQRIRAWELAHDLNVGQDLLLGNAIIQLGASKDAWSTLAGYVLKHRVGLIIFDTFARMSLGLEENSASDVGKAITRFDQIRKLTQAGVLVVHHTGKVGTSGRGSSALNGALDTEMLVTPGTWDTAAVQVQGEPADFTTSKQKNGPRLRDPIQLYLAEMYDSVVITGPTGTIGDPLDTSSVAPLRVAEPIVETAIRLHEYATRFPAQGVTRGELILGVEPDDYTAARANAAVQWKRAVHEAVDLGLRYGLLETLSGTASGMRYIVSTATPEAARLRAAQEAMAD